MDNINRTKPIDASNMELELMVEDELSRLQRQYRIMESDRIAYLDHVKRNMGKQSHIIDNLTKEQSALLINLHVADSKHNKRKDVNILMQVKNLLDNHSILSEKITVRKTYVSELDYQIRKVQKQITTIRYDMRQIDSSNHERLALVQAHLIKLENKLETSNNRFGIVLAQNKRLREGIDHLLSERQLFNKNWQSLFTKLESSKKFMLDLIEQATLAYDQREEWCQKLDALRMRAFADLQYHSEEMRELQRTLDHDAGLQNFLRIKGQRRIAGNLLKKELMKREEAKIELRAQTDKYSKILHEIQHFAGDSDVSHLASQFVKQEEENFALFNYIHELNSELESLSDSIGAVQLKIDEQKQIHNKRSFKQVENIEYITKVLLESTAEADVAHQECSSLNQQLRNIFAGIERLFHKINCDKAPILDLLGQIVASRGERARRPSAAQISVGQSATETENAEPLVETMGHKQIIMSVHNVRLYLGILEDKINESIKNIFHLKGINSKGQIISEIKRNHKPKVAQILAP